MMENEKIINIEDRIEEKDKFVSSVFAYRNNMSYEAPSYKAAGEQRISDLVREGTIREREKLILSFLYEMGEMTAHQIQMAFEHPAIDKGLTKLSRNKNSNPYMSEIALLEHHAVIRSSRIKVRDKLTTKIYGLSKAAASWYYKTMLPGNRYYDMTKVPEFKIPKETVIDELGHLSSVTYHIREVCSNLYNLNSFSPRYVEGINVFNGYYKYTDGSSSLLISVRNPETESKKVINALNCSLLRSEKNYLVLLTADEITADELRDYIKTAEGYSDERVLYTTDLSAHTLEGSPKSFRYTGNGKTFLLSSEDLKKREDE